MTKPDRLANRHFLVVDDEQFIRNLVVRFLKQSGAAEVVEAADGREAIAAITSHDMVFDAVITDINMRVMNGIELLSAIRTGAHGLKRNMPVLMLTAHAEAGLVADALALDADAFVVKPVGREALIERIGRVLERTVPIQPVASYKEVGIAEKTGVSAARANVGPAPPTKPLNISIESLMGMSSSVKTEAPSSLRPVMPSSLKAEIARGPGDPAIAGYPVNEAKEMALGNVKENAILAQDIYFGDPQKLLLAAPVILTKVMLDRLKDLRQIHEYSRVFVIDPRA